MGTKQPGDVGFAYDWDGTDPELELPDTPEWDAELELIALSVERSPITAAVRLAYTEGQERDDSGKFGEGGGGGTTKVADDRPTYAGTSIEPVQLLADGKVGYNEANGLPAPSDRDWSQVMADPELGAQIAADYDNMQDYNPAAEPAYDALAGEVSAQFDYLTNTLGVTVEFTDHDPYENVAMLKADIEQNGHLGVLRTDATPPGHPYISNEANDQFRAVHDAFGHAAIGRSFDRNGEEAAFQSHAEMFTATSLPALASETRGQNSALNYGGYGARGEFPPQKFDLLPSADLQITERTLAAAVIAAVGSADDDNLYDVTGSHHVSAGRSFNKPPNPPRPAPAHTSLGRGAGARIAYSEEQERDAGGKFGSGGGETSSKSESGSAAGNAATLRELSTKTDFGHAEVEASSPGAMRWGVTTEHGAHEDAHAEAVMAVGRDVETAVAHWSYGQAVEQWRDEYVAYRETGQTGVSTSGRTNEGTRTYEATIDRGTQSFFEMLDAGPRSDAELYRGTTSHSDERVGSLRVGDRIPDGISSWSRDPAVADVFRDVNAGYRSNGVQVEMRLEPGARAVDVAALGIQEYAWQKEVIVGGALEVTSITKTDAGPLGLPVYSLTVKAAT